MPVFLVTLNPPPPKFYLVGKMWGKNKTKSPSQIPERAIFVIRLGFEPKTHSLEGCCSIQLSYRTVHADGKLLSTAVCKDSPFWANGKLFFSKGKRDFGTVLE